MYRKTLLHFIGSPSHLGFVRVAVWLACLLLPPLADTARAAEAPEPKRVLALYWYGKDFSSNIVFDKVLKSTFESAQPGPIEYYAEYWESDRFPGEDQSLALRDYLSRKYADRKIDVIVATTRVALDFLIENRKRLFPRVPIVFHSTLRPKLDDDGGRVTGIWSGNSYPKTLDLALRLHPEAKQAFIIHTSAKGYKQGGIGVRAELWEFESKVKVNYLIDLPLDELLSRVKKIPEHSVVLYGRYSQDEPRTVLDPHDALALIARSTDVPIYGVSSSYLGRGIVGGSVLHVDASASKLAEIAMRLAQGTPPRDIPVEEIPSTPMFDWRQLQRWNIAESALPEGSIVRFREPAFWERYRSRIIALVLFCLFQTSLIGFLLIERRRRRKVARELRKANDELNQSMAQIKNLSGRLIAAQEEERKRISRGLHEDLNQQVAVLGMQLSAVKRELSGDDTTSPQLARVQDRLTCLAESIRLLSRDLHPAILEQTGLAVALSAHCEEFERLNGIKVYMKAIIGRSIASDVSLCLYRIAQEALRNVAQHSNSKEAWVSLSQADDQIELTINDSGPGFDPARATGKGIGVVSMKERVRLVGGTFQLDSSAGRSTTIRVRVPARVSEVPLTAP